jgi:hypothetical protein
MGGVQAGEARVSRSRPKLQAATGVGLAALLAGAIWAQPARASEGGASLYLLGSGGPEAAMLPPLEGVFFDNTFYYYSGSAGANKHFEVGGNVVAGLSADIYANFTTVLWVPTTNFLGATVALGAALPLGAAPVNVSAILTGPLGRQFSVSKTDEAFIVGDPLLTGSLGWKSGDFSVAASTLLNIPVGEYRDGQLSNLAFHRWAGDLSLAGTWHNDKVGWDISAKAGFTFNGTNQATDYTTGTEFHVEGSIEKTLSKSFSAGAQIYYFNQVTADSGLGNKIGPFEGRVTGAGGSAAYRFTLLKKIPATLRLRLMHEFDVQNRLQGTSAWIDFSMPLSVKLPTAPHPPS